MPSVFFSQPITNPLANAVGITPKTRILSFTPPFPRLRSKSLPSLAWITGFLDHLDSSNMGLSLPTRVSPRIYSWPKALLTGQPERLFENKSDHVTVLCSKPSNNSHQYLKICQALRECEHPHIDHFTERLNIKAHWPLALSGAPQTLSHLGVFA